MEASLGTYRLQGVCQDKVLPVIIQLILNNNKVLIYLINKYIILEFINL